MSMPRPTDASAAEMLAAARSFDRLMGAIGRLNYTWTNTESVLMPVLARLLGIEHRHAAIIFMTLNTTRARLDLIERIVRSEPGGPEESGEGLVRAVRRFRKLSNLRNKLNHSIYDVDPATGTARTQSTRVSMNRDDIQIGQTEMLDAAELSRIDAQIEELRGLNRVFWDYLETSDQQLREAASASRGAAGA